MTSIRKEIMEEFEKLWRKEIKLAGHDNTNPLYKLTNGLGAFESFLSLSLTRIEEAVRGEFEYRINGAKFMYEHSWFDGYPEKCCEMCGERIKNNTPCKASPYYKFWLILDSLVSPSEEKECTSSNSTSSSLEEKECKHENIDTDTGFNKPYYCFDCRKEI